VSGTFLHLIGGVGHQAMGLAWTSAAAPASGSTRQKICPFALIDPVAQVTYVVLAAGGQVGLMCIGYFVD
jgi:hypothetical protein